jgi:lon-related putative ATP-dependent protease
MEVKTLQPDELFHCCDPEKLSFESTDELDELTEVIGQPRAEASLHFGIGIQREGYNVYALGEPGTGKQTLVRKLLDDRASEEDPPADVCYVNNFEEPHKPRILVLKPGRGRSLADNMQGMVEEVRNALRAAFENEEYQNRRQSIAKEFQEKQQQAFEELQKKADEYGLSPLRTPSGLVFAPVKDGEVVPPDEFDQLSEEERKQLEEKASDLQAEAQKVFQKIPQWQREIRESQKELNREVTGYAVGPVIAEIRKKYDDNESVVDYLNAVESDIVENAAALLQQEGEGQEGQQQQTPQMQMGTPGQGPNMESPALRRYKVNVVVDNSEASGAPVVFEDHPTYQNLVGRVEHLAQMGALLTDFNMIRAGALHRANGGYLILDALKVLQQPFAWEGLKRALRSRQIKIESPGQMYSLISTVSLEPEPVPLRVKVVLLGIPLLYYMIRHYDPEFSELFKVGADFAYRMDRDEESQHSYSRLIATAVRKEGLRAFDRGAVARVIEHSARTVGDSRKLSMHMQGLIDLLRESDYWAGENGNGIVRKEDVQTAIDSWIFRSDRLREAVQEQIQRDIVYIDTDGEKVGQINGLSVIQLGDFAFGRPSRITARIRLGKGEVVDIEREVAMGGPIHSKGVLILAGFLGERYALHQPLSLSASLVFEQSYGGIEGDSASSAELYALLSSIADIPIRQSLAVTGSVNQHGRVQPIGGVNEKIEGFFDTCRGKGLTGNQGVLIPESNVQHLMLRRDVIEAVEQGKFHIYPVRTIDQGLEILTGMSAGELDSEGRYPEDSVNGKVHRRLEAMAQTRKKFAAMETVQKGETEHGGA